MSEREKALELMRLSEPGRIKKRKAKEEAEAKRKREEGERIQALEDWARDEMIALTSRPMTKFVDVPLDPLEPDGPTIRLRTHLTEAEILESANLIDESMAIVAGHIVRDDEGKIIGKGTPSDEEVARQNEITARLIAMVTANPMLTEAWFFEAQASYAREDLRNLIALVVNQIQAIIEDRKRTQYFRPDAGRPEGRPDAT